MDCEFRKRFLTNTDESGRFTVKSMITGKIYFVEPIADASWHRVWGDIDPASKALCGEYGKKFKGAVSEEESMITKENGFDKICELKPGESPIDYINRIDKEYQKQMDIKNEI